MPCRHTIAVVKGGDREHESVSAIVGVRRFDCDTSFRLRLAARSDSRTAAGCRRGQFLR
jgi:hypothetical protein